MKNKENKSNFNILIYFVVGIFLVTILAIFYDSIFIEEISNSDLNYTDKIIIQQPVEENRLSTNNLSSEEKSLEEYMAGKFNRKFEWDYRDYTYEITLTLYPEVYKLFKQRERTRDYDLFASDFYSKDYIKSLTEELREFGEEEGLDDEEIPYFIISFIQSLPYTSDDVTTGFDEYPRFPYETFYDNGGDCEDTSILASAMLRELGYGVVLLQFSNHMAVGIRCEPSAGQSYYTYQEIDFCYLETTGEGYEVGDIPIEYKDKKATIIPLIERPMLEIEFTSKYEYNKRDVYTNVNVEVKNLGSKTAENTKIYVALQTTDITKVWSQIQSDALEIGPEEIYFYNVTNLHSLTGQPFRIYIRAWGDNVISDESVSSWVYWE